MATRAKQQVVEYYAYDTVAGTYRTGDNANHSLFWVKDGTKAATTNSGSEVSSTDCPGLYKVTLTSTECDCDIGTLHGKSSTTGVILVPVTIQFERLPDAVPGEEDGVSIVGSEMTIAASARVKLDADQPDYAPAKSGEGVPRVISAGYVGNVVANATGLFDFRFMTVGKDGKPITLAGTPAIAVMSSNSATLVTTGLTLTTNVGATGVHNVRVSLTDTYYAGAASTVANFSVILTAGTVDGVDMAGSQCGLFSANTARTTHMTTAGTGSIGNTALAVGSVTDTAMSSAAVSKIQSGLALSTDMTTLLARITSARAGYLDNLNAGGVLASQADINALNQSASRRIVATTVSQFERPETGDAEYWIDVRTYDGDGAVVNADSTPALSATGIVSGDLSANLSSAANPSTGLYRWVYTVSVGDTLEHIRFDASATIGSSTFVISVNTQTADFVAATLTTDDRDKLTSIYNALPGGVIAGAEDIPTLAEINAEADQALADYDGPTKAEMDAGFDALNDLDSTGAQEAAAAALADYDPPTRAEVTADKAEILTDTVAIKSVTDQIDGMLEVDGAVSRWTANALEEAPSGSGATLAEIVAALSGSTITINSPYEPDTGILTIICGDDYTESSGKAFTVEVESAALPDLDGATIALTIRHKRISGLTIVGTGDLISQDSDGATITVSIPRTETTKGRTGAGRSSWLYDLQATLEDGTVLTLNNAQGTAQVLLDQTQ